MHVLKLQVLSFRHTNAPLFRRDIYRGSHVHERGAVVSSCDFKKLSMHDIHLFIHVLAQMKVENIKRNTATFFFFFFKG